MDVETIEAIGKYIITPLILLVVLWILIKD